MEVKVNQVYKSVHAAIGEQKMTMGEIEQIEEGDIIPLHTKVSDQLRGYVDGKHKFNCFIEKTERVRRFYLKSFVE